MDYEIKEVTKTKSTKRKIARHVGSGKSWIKDDEMLLAKMYAQGDSYENMCKTLGRSLNSLRTRVTQLKKQGLIIDEAFMQDIEDVTEQNKLEEGMELLSNALNKCKKENKRKDLMIDLLTKELYRLKDV